jgi:hypothetical protein
MSRPPPANAPPTSGVIADDPAPGKSSKPLKTNEPEKRGKTRQNSSKLVKTAANPLISLKKE